MNPGGNGTVVGVTISGPSTVPITSTIQLTATGNPTGGAYSWTASNSDVTLTNASTATVTVAGSAAGTSAVTVTYTQNEMKGTATQSITVQKPTSLRSAPSSAPYSCTNVSPALKYTTNEAQITYTVLDQNGNPIASAGIPVVESFSPISNSCAGVPNTPTATSGQTNADGVFGPDDLYVCSSSCLPANGSGQPTGACSVKVSQTWRANGYSVQTKTITYTCSGPPSLQ